MPPEKILELFKNVGGGILVILGVLFAAYIVIAFLRLTKKPSGADQSPSPGGPSEERTDDSESAGGDEGGG